VCLAGETATPAIFVSGESFNSDAGKLSGESPGELLLLSITATSPVINVSRELLVGLSSQGRTTCVITC
jgi:hypothetical protein